MQVPLIFSLRIVVKVKHLCLWDKGASKVAKRSSKAVPAEMLVRPNDNFFAVPASYEEHDFKNWLEREQSKMRSRPDDSSFGSACNGITMKASGFNTEP